MPQKPLWLSSPTDFTLASGEVHIWCASLDQPIWRLQKLAQALSASEQERAVRFHFERDRRRFIASHGMLRAILSRYLGMEPGQLQFFYGAYGKPALAETLNRKSLCFNMSHSHKLTFYAVAREHEVGVDIEYVRPLPDLE